MDSCYSAEKEIGEKWGGGYSCRKRERWIGVERQNEKRGRERGGIMERKQESERETGERGQSVTALKGQKVVSEDRQRERKTQTQTAGRSPSNSHCT